MLIIFRHLLLFLSCFYTSYAASSVVIGSTRVIYNEGKREVQVQLKNNGDKPFLIQNWIDIGNADSLPTGVSVPFVTSPPISRIEAGEGALLRIFLNDTEKVLSRDIESVFWLNVLAAPPKVKSNEDNNQLQIAFRTRIKLFYRPQGLSDERLLDVPQKLVVTKSDRGLLVTNPSEFHISIAHILLENSISKFRTESKMISPKSSALFEFEEDVNFDNYRKAELFYINDFGGMANVEYIFK